MTEKRFELSSLRKKIDKSKKDLGEEAYQDIIGEVRAWEEFISRSEGSIRTLTETNAVLRESLQKAQK